MSQTDDFLAHFRKIQLGFSRLYARILTAADLTLPQYALLNQLASEGTASMTGVSRGLHITKPAVTSLVDRLEKKRLLKRVAHAHDRRVSLLEIQPKGRSIVRSVQRRIFQLLLKTLAPFDTREQSVIRRFYALLAKTLSLGMTLVCVGTAGAMGKAPGEPARSAPAVRVSEVQESPRLYTLEECFRLALEQSESLAIREEAIAQTTAQFFKATSEALGDIDFIVTDTRQDAPGGGDRSSFAGSSTAQHRRERKFTISQPLFQGFKSLGAIGGAGSLKKQRRGEWLRAKHLLFLDVAAAFYDVLRFRHEEEAIDEILSLYRERTRDLREREKIGRSRASEVVSAQARMRSLEAQRAGTRGDLAAAQDLLSFLTGLPLTADELADDMAIEDESLALDAYLEAVPRRPDVEAARAAVKTAWNGVVVAQSGYWPTVTLENNNYVKREGFQSGFDWDVILKLDVPLFRGGETTGKVKEAWSTWKTAKHNYSLARRSAVLDIQEAYRRWFAAVAEHRALAEAVKASAENHRLQKDDYEHNLVSNLEVLDALESLEETRRESNDAYYDMKENFRHLQVATGEVA